jgi:anthranilate 1,2-dioxygenase small subunit
MTDSVYQQITRAQADYARCIDDDRLEQWPDHFHGSCIYKITTAANLREGLEGAIIFANSKGMLKDRVSALREANIYERQSYRHILGQPSILQESATEVRSETSFLVARIVQDGETDIFATGRYLDCYKIEEGKVLLDERIVVCDSSRVDTLLALPL